jgi:hypothetical protein
MEVASSEALGNVTFRDIISGGTKIVSSIEVCLSCYDKMLSSLSK